MLVIDVDGELVLMRLVSDVHNARVLMLIMLSIVVWRQLHIFPVLHECMATKLRDEVICVDMYAGMFMLCMLYPSMYSCF